MKKFLFLFVTFIILGSLSSQVMAQATESTAASAVIITPITITETAPLHFGVMSVLSGTAGTCILSTTGVRTATAGVNLSAQAPLATNAAYTVGGAINTTYAITLPVTSVVTNGTPAEDMTISTWLARSDAAGADGPAGTLSATGADTFTVGATLTVAAAQPPGTYTGTFDVTVAYN